MPNGEGPGWRENAIQCVSLFRAEPRYSRERSFLLLTCEASLTMEGISDRDEPTFFHGAVAQSILAALSASDPRATSERLGRVRE